MLGRRDPQQSLFAAQSLPHCVPADSFYVRMGAVSATLLGTTISKSCIILTLDGPACRPR